jgi:hypothetical protein
VSDGLLMDPSACERDRHESGALVKAILSLMTDHALACCDGHRAGVQERIAACFLALSLSSGLTRDSRALALQLHRRWLPAAPDDSPVSRLAARPPRGGLLHHDNHVLWHTTPELIQ